jgi:predicted esterase
MTGGDVASPATTVPDTVASAPGASNDATDDANPESTSDGSTAAAIVPVPTVASEESDAPAEPTSEVDVTPAEQATEDPGGPETDMPDADGLIADTADNPDASNADAADSAEDPSQDVGPSTAYEDAVPSEGCGQPWIADDVELDERFNAPRRQVARREMELGAAQREYLVSLPEEYDPSKPYALIFAFHGLGGDREQLRGYMNMEGPADSEAVVIYPGGLPVGGGDTGWELDEPSDDLAFVDSLLDKYTSELCIDRSRLFATGHSYGGCMSNSVGCYRGDVFRAIAPVAGCGPFAWNLECVGRVAAMIVHSPLDAVEDYSSGVNACTRSLQASGCDDPEGCGCYWEESLDDPADECLNEAQQPHTSAVSIEVDERDEKPPALREYLNCDPGYPVVQVDYWRRERQQVDAPGERWHNPPPWAPELIWEFFSSLPPAE